MKADFLMEAGRTTIMAVSIPCPQCGSILKLRDRSMLGRTGKCPKCGHRFTLVEPPPTAKPDEIELELAEPPAEDPLVRPASARRVGTNATASPASPDSASSATPAPEIPAFGDSPAIALDAGRSPLHRRKRTRQRRLEIIVGGLVALAAAGTMWAGYDFLKSQPKSDRNPAPPAPQQNVAYLSERERLEKIAELIDADSPTKGEPITLDYVPAGASIVIHLHPAELWKAGSIGEEVRYCLGEDFKNWTDAQITKYCLLPPAEIKEATLCLILAARGSAPQVATVVSPVTPRKTSELIALFDGSPQDIDGEQVYVGSERAAIISKSLDDEKRPRFFATAPASMATDLALSASGPGIASDAIEAALKETDRQRHATFVFRPADLRIHEETLVPADLRPAWNQMLDRFDDDSEAAAWSLHFDQDDLVSELVVRNVPMATTGQVHQRLTSTLQSLPEDLVTTVSRMNPAEIGDRKLIGRFPAMVQLFVASTVAGTGDRSVYLQTRLPERAGPNLALAGLLAWNESTRTDFSKPASGDPATPATPRTPLAERLKKPIEIDFRRTPLEEAFAYIGDETGVAFEIDGDALKFSGYTRNMPQTITLGSVPAEKAVATILAAYDKMAVVLDEAGNKAIVTTKPVAEEKGLTPATFRP